MRCSQKAKGNIVLNFMVKIICQNFVKQPFLSHGSLKTFVQLLSVSICVFDWLSYGHCRNDTTYTVTGSR